ncbi:esterase/lipase family protein [Xanthomonas nasturtii]|uniref:Alpha/beta hydrolase n=1 Tax=Xanthomonas nasturtii TaxID=1843581 RepID=A0ABT0LV55_9XANT|nr:alpha/beta hydrolase [Xanthomonas nasturtii]MCL1557328.1 alpha/beta hydrolase [Xanthomonas nasturtii]MCL1559275.1 alpha/beta hydrolase [Xanthomonas nasturtii]
MMPRMRMCRTAAVLAGVLASFYLSGCAMVTVQSRNSGDYIAQTRGDVLSTGELSQSGSETLQVAGLQPKACRADPLPCLQQLTSEAGIGDERRLATQAELWTAHAIALSGRTPTTMSDAAVDAWLEAARHAYAYLFFTARAPSARAFENRQTQARDYYNYAVQQVVERLFARSQQTGQTTPTPTTVGRWQLGIDLSAYRLPGGGYTPRAIFAASALRFNGVRSTYRRDGFGAELVAEVDPHVVGDPAGLALQQAAAVGTRPDRPLPTFSEMPYTPATVLLRFEGDTLAEVLRSNLVTMLPYDPYRQNEVVLHGQRVPLAANFTAAYGLWLARSGFAAQSLRSMLGSARGIDHPHLYLMQPYDPNRRVLLMLHGLASSPEAWVNVANEVMGDETLRQRYQIWQVYYPTNAPMAVNRAEIQSLVERSLRHFDPSGSAIASHDMVLIGHSMGGVIGRLLVSSSGEQLWNSLLENYRLEGERGARVRAKLSPLLHFSPMPQIDRAIFIAAPHRGTPLAEGGLGRLVGKLVRLPIALLDRFGDVMQDLASSERADHGGEYRRKGRLLVPTSIDNLRDTDPFVRATMDLPISPRVRYHTIIGREKPQVPLADSDDGLVPYRSAHLDGAASELVVTSWHSVQETPQAILEIRRILHAQLQAKAAGSTAAQGGTPAAPSATL